MKKIFIVALLASFISTASAKNVKENLLIKPNVDNSSLLSKASARSFNGFCYLNCTNDYNYCLANPRPGSQPTIWLAGCEIKLEVCNSRCYHGGNTL